MAYSTISKPSLYFNTKLYTGNGGTNAITGIGFQPDWVWIKNRTGADSHSIYDAVRGVNKVIRSNTTAAEGTQTDGLTAFGTDGFTVGASGSVNTNSNNFASWNWKANGAGSANTDGDINSTVSVNQTAGFSIVKYTGNGYTNQTVGHGLGTTPKFKIIKSLGASAEGAVVTGAILGSTVGQRIFLNTTSAVGNPSGYYALDTATTIGISGSNNPTSQNANGEGYIAYCFAEKTGYSKFGTYTGNGNANGTFVYTGFKPAWIMCRDIDNAAGWHMFDNKRPNTFNVINKRLEADNSDAEGSASGCEIDLVSSGFKLRGNFDNINRSGSNHIFMAFAEEPLVANVGANGVPATAR